MGLDIDSEEEEFITFMATLIKERLVKKALSMSIIPTPNVEVQVLIEIYATTIEAIAYMDKRSLQNHNKSIHPFKTILSSSQGMI